MLPRLLNAQRRQAALALADYLAHHFVAEVSHRARGPSSSWRCRLGARPVQRQQAALALADYLAHHRAAEAISRALRPRLKPALRPRLSSDTQRRQAASSPPMSAVARSGIPGNKRHWCRSFSLARAGRYNLRRRRRDRMPEKHPAAPDHDTLLGSTSWLPKSLPRITLMRSLPRSARRPSVSALITELAEQHRDELEKEAGG